MMARAGAATLRTTAQDPLLARGPTVTEPP